MNREPIFRVTTGVRLALAGWTLFLCSLLPAADALPAPAEASITPNASVFPEKANPRTTENVEPTAEAAPVRRKHTQTTSVSAEQSSLATPEAGAEGKASKMKRHRTASRTELWPFLLRKARVFGELAFYICIGVLLGQILEVAGFIRYIAIIAWPLLWLGRLPKVAGAPFIMAFQSGAVANTMLVNARDEGELSRRQLYTSVLVVSCLSLFVHLPTYIMPLGAALGAQAAGVFFAVRFAAILAELLVVLLVSSLLVRRFTGDPLLPGDPLPARKDSGAEATENAGVTSCPCAAEKPQPAVNPEKGGSRGGMTGFLRTVWRRSRRTLVRLLLFVVPTFAVMSGLEWYGIFDWLEKLFDGLSCPWLPASAPAIIAAQAVSLNNGAMAAGSLVTDGTLTTAQAVVVLLAGSLLTAPVRTLKHALPTYAAVLGMRPGTVMAVTAQALRLLFLGAATLLLIWLWA